MRTFELDYTTGVAPLTVTARLFTMEWTTWRWLLDGAIHKNPDGSVDGMAHVFILSAGTHTISVRGVDRATGATVQDEAITVTVAPAPVVLPAFQYGMETFSPLADETELVALADNGYTVCRVEAPATLSGPITGVVGRTKADADLRAYYDNTIAQYAKYNLTCHWVIEPQEAPYLPAGSRCDFMNEMNIGWRAHQKMTPSQYRELLLAALRDLLPRGVTVFAGVASDTDTTAVEWTRQVLVGVPPEVGVAWHRYPEQNNFNKPKKGWKNRSTETAALKTVNGTRRFIISECCYPSQYVQEYLYGLIKVKRTMSLDAQLQAERVEWAYWEDQGAEGVYRYQIRDGVGDTFGAKMLDGKWRKVLQLPKGV
jgi:hypothetical protein